MEKRHIGGMFAVCALVAGVGLPVVFGAPAASAASDMSHPAVGPIATPADYASTQVAVSTYWSDDVHICGDDQYGDWVCSPQFNTPGTGRTTLWNWWWEKGTVVQIWGKDETHHKGYRMDCALPSLSPSVVYCDGRSNREL